MLYLKEESILEKTTKELRNRNKIIRIADKYGWDVVEEYKTHAVWNCLRIEIWVWSLL
jgi:hypothetical protein